MRQDSAFVQMAISMDFCILMIWRPNQSLKLTEVAPDDFAARKYADRKAKPEHVCATNYMELAVRRRQLSFGPLGGRRLSYKKGIPMKPTAISLFIILLVTGCSRGKTITGEIFIVTQGGQNYKLGLVNVGLIQSEKLKSHLDAKIKEANIKINPIYNDYKQLKDSIALLAGLGDEYDRKIRNWTDESLPGLDKKLKLLYKARSVAYDKLRLLNKLAPVETIYLTYTSGDYFLSNLPKLDDSSKTDSDGQFKLIVPNNEKYFIVASASRSVGEKKEYYYWMIEYPNSSFREDQKILLSNDNLFDPLTKFNFNNKEIQKSSETKNKSAA